MSIASVIEEKLRKAFSPKYLEVVNESNNHNVPPGSESHFKVTIVSNNFDGERLIKRHRAVNSILSEELAEKIHALAIHTYTPKEWADFYAANQLNSPQCLGGSK